MNVEVVEEACHLCTKIVNFPRHTIDRSLHPIKPVVGVDFHRVKPSLQLVEASNDC